MKIIYLGTPYFAVTPLKALVENGFNIVAVISQPDKPTGRKKEIKPTPVKEYALSQGIKVLQFEKIKKHVDDIKQLDADIMITCAYGQILSQEIIDITKYGIYNIHASLLPLYRGASPIASAILNGDKQTGITIMKTDIGIDDGDIVATEKTDILPNETCGELFVRLSKIGADLIVKVLPEIENGTVKLVKQDNNNATFCKMIKKQDALINWNLSAEKILKMVRAYNPSPIAYTSFKGKMLKIYSAEISQMQGNVGVVLKADKSGFIVACGENSLFLKEVQQEGGKKMPYTDFVLGRKILAGDCADL